MNSGSSGITLSCQERPALPKASHGNIPFHLCRPSDGFRVMLAAITALETMRGLHEFGSGCPVVELSRTGLDPMPKPAQLFNFLHCGQSTTLPCKPALAIAEARGRRVPLLPK
jgi:hypothetical protein